MTAGRRFVVVALLFGCRAAAPPSSDPARWRLVEELRLGSLEEGPTGFSDVRAVHVDRRNRLWVLDFGVQEIRVFDSTGQFVRRVGRRGNGPGEFVYADGILPGIDGTIWVQDPQNQRLTGFNQDGEFVAQVPAFSTGYGFVSRGGVDSAGRLWDDFFMAVEGPPAQGRYRRFAPDMTRADTVDLAGCNPPPGAPERRIFRGRGGGFAIPFDPSPVAGIDFNGRIACIPWAAEYSGVFVDLLTGDTLGRFRHAGGLIPIRPSLRDSEVTRMTDFAKRVGATGFSASLVPTERPAIQRLVFDDQGRLWVRRLTAEEGTEFDVFDGAGTLVATIESPFAPASYLAPVFRGDRIYFIASGTDDISQVVRIRIERSPSP